MSDIVLSAGVRQNLLSLQSTAQLMSQTQNRLATGKKVNTALDNPTNYFTSSALQSRSKDFSALLDSMSNGIKVLEGASNGITAINRTIESMQSTLRQARQDKSFQSISYALDPLMDTSTAKYLAISGGAVGTPAVQIALNTADSVGATKTASTAGGQFSTIQSAFNPATSATFTAGAYSGTGVDFTNGGGNNGQITFNLRVDGGALIPITIGYADVSGAQTVSGGSAVTVAELRDIINAKAGGNVASVDGGGNLVFSSGSTGAGSSVAITGFSATNGATGSGIADDSATGTAAGSGVGFTLTVGTGAAKTITVSRADVLAAGIDLTTNGGINSVNLQAAINTKLGLAGITTVQAAKSGGPGVSAATDTINLQAVSVGAGTTFTVANVIGIVNVTGTAVTPGAGTPGNIRTVDELVSDINSNTGLKDKVRASNDNGKLRVENLSTQVLSLTGVNASTGKITGGSGSGTINGNEVRKNFVTQFNGFIDQLNKLADDASYNGVNLLRGDKLKITFNENGSSTIEIQARDAQGNPTAVNTNTLGILQATDQQFDSDEVIDGRLQVLTNALGQLRAQASAFGSNLSVVQNRQDFTKSMINTLQTGADSLVLADTNEEGANMLALQTRQQLSTTALSLSAQADQAVLRLFG
jgi:flagellin-like hook-associated protein FlgL